MHNHDLNVIFEDNHQLVLNKPNGLLTQPSGTDQESLEAFAKEWLKKKYNKPGNVFLESVHRIDRPVSGIVVFAKTSKALSRLNSALRDKRSHKVYRAIVEGVVRDDGVLEHYLVHDDFHARVVSSSFPDSKFARLQYKVIKKNKDRSLLEIVLETGRYHQIRVQLSAMGHPIIGDDKYGSKHAFKEGAIALHHYQLQLPHPITDEIQTFEAPTPWEF